MAKVHEDLEIIKALPPQLRRFVQDDEDAELLLAAATDVFRNPKAAAGHQADFFQACLGKTRVRPTT
jgi:hypothetical protein